MSGTDSPSSPGSPERHGSLEPDDSRKVTGALGGGAVREPGGADQQQGGERWGGQQSQSQGGQSQVQGVGQHGQAFTAEEAARGREAAFGESAQQAQADRPAGQPGFDPQAQGIVDQQGESLGGDAHPGGGQHEQFAPAAGQQGGGQPRGNWEQGSPQAQQPHPYAGQIREHMEVIGADGVHLGTVDKVEGNRIKLTKADSGMGGHQGHHHFISCGLVAEIEGDKVRLSATAANAYALEEEE